MNKKFITKILLVFLFFIIAFNFIMSPCVNAAEKKENKKIYATNDFLSEEDLITTQSTNEGKIEMYDATTGETTQIDMNELRNDIANTYATNGKKITRTQPYNPCFEKQLVTATPRSGYVRVFNPSENYPYRVVCRIKADEIIDGNEMELVASGFLVGPNLLLTNAHSVMNKDKNDAFFENWVAYPAYDNGEYNNYSSGWAKIYYSSNWKSSHAIGDDWCLCILYENLGSELGWLGCQHYGTSEAMQGLSIKTVGYPASEGFGENQYYSIGSIQEVEDYFFSTSASITGGMSGGPVIQTSDDYVAGINKGYTGTEGVAVKINQDIIDLILDNS